MGTPWELLALAQTGSFALKTAEVVELGAANASGTDHIDMIDYARVDGEDALHALAEADFADGDGFAHTGIIAGNERALERLQPLLVAFLDFDVDAEGVAGPERGDIRTQALLDKLRH